MKINIVGAFIRNHPFGSEIAFKKGFDRLGGHTINTIDTSYPDQKFMKDADLTIVFKWMEGDYWQDLKETSGIKIVYQPDDSRFPHIRKMMEEMRKFCDYAFTFDNDGAQIAREIGYKDAKCLLLTADDDLYRNIPGSKKHYDFCFIGSMTGGPSHKSRQQMVSLIAQEFPQSPLCFASDVYNIESIVAAYNTSKIILNHATDVGQRFGTGYGYQCRHFEAGFTNACVLSNVVLNEKKLYNFVSYNSTQDLLEKAAYLLSDEQSRKAYAANFYMELKTHHRPEHRAQEVLDFVKGLQCA